jgi:ribosomal protein S8
MNNFNQLINKIKWGYTLKKPYIDVPAFSLGKKIIKYLTKIGFISGFEIIYQNFKKLNVGIINLHSIKINNLNHLRLLYSKFFGKEFINLLTDELFIQLMIQEDPTRIKFFKNNKLTHDIILYILSPNKSLVQNKIIYWNKDNIYDDLNWFNKLNFKYIRIFLKYQGNSSSIKDIISLALPNRFFFWTVENMIKAPQSKKLRVKNLLKFRSKYIRMRINYIISTTKGIMSIENAISLNLGGKVLFKIYS